MQNQIVYHPSEPRQRLVDWLIRVRERALAFLLGVDRKAVLNPGADQPTSVSGLDVVAELTQIVDAFRAATFEPQGSRVDYRQLRESAAFVRYRTECVPRLRTLDPLTLGTWQERLAFWINLYNLLVIDAVISFGVRHSVTEGHAGILRFFRHAAYEVRGERFSLEDIEHGILRANRGHPFLPGPHFASTDPRLAHTVARFDPRIHFALNCGSRSCPPIRTYSPEALETQLELATSSFLASEVQVLSERHEVRVSRLFHWYAQDFHGRDGLLMFLLHHHPDEACRDWLQGYWHVAQLTYRPYDWRLNN